MKRVLMLSASHNDERLIRALKKLGCYVITTGNRPDLSGHKLADEYEYGDYSDLDKMLALAKELRVDAVCPCCNDFGVKTAAYVQEKLGLKGQDSYETTLTLHDKDKFKRFAEELGGIRTPLAKDFTREQDAMLWAQSEIDFPVIVKPVDLSAGNGIHRADNLAELQDCIMRAFAASREKRIVIEPFIEGTQHGFCTYIINKKVVAVCTNNEHSFINKYRVEVDTYPADHADLVRVDLIMQIERMANALDLTDGIFHLQYILKDGKAHILECMRRVLGNLYSIPAEGLGEGFDWDYWEVRAKCGFDVASCFPKKVPETGFWAYRALIARCNGVFTGVHTSPELEKHVYSKWMLCEPGHIIENYLSEPMGFYFLRFNNAEEMHRVVVEHYDDTYVCVR